MAKTARTATKRGKAPATTKRVAAAKADSKDKRIEKTALIARSKAAPRKIKAAAKPPHQASTGKLATAKSGETEAPLTALVAERRGTEMRQAQVDDDDAPPDSIQIQDLAQVVRRVLARGKLSASRIVVAKDKLTVEIPRRAVEKLAL